jgi:hypothetical protein
LSDTTFTSAWHSTQHFWACRVFWVKHNTKTSIVVTILYNFCIISKFKVENITYENDEL